MSIVNTMLEALTDAVKEPPCLDNRRLSVLRVWFSDKDVAAYVELYHRLADSESRATFLKLLHNSIGQLLAGNIEIYRNFSKHEWRGFELVAADMRPLAPTYSGDLIGTWILDGYSYKDICCVRPGDRVLDCGAYTGNTAFYFADFTGPEGKVYALEPMPKSFGELEKNIRASGYTNIFAHQYAVADSCGNACFTELANEGSRKIDSGGIAVPQISIDAFVQKKGLDRVDFIKMDIEGCENSALLGAAHTIRRFKPRLAICIYHRADDFIVIPKTILELNPGYKFYLKHNCFNFFETVLFAVPDSGQGEVLIDTTEFEEARNAWKAIEAVQASRTKVARQNLLMQYAEQVTKKYPFLGAPMLDANCVYAYWPLSEDYKLQYRFLIWGDRCEISLRFDGKHAKQTELLKRICAESILSLSESHGFWTGCFFVNKDIYATHAIFELMEYLIKFTLPILARNRLLSNKLLISLLNSGHDLGLTDIIKYAAFPPQLRS